MDRATAFEVVQRSTVSEVYSQIISDLEYAIENLPGENKVESGRATVDGAKALLAKSIFINMILGAAKSCWNKLLILRSMILMRI